MNWRPVWLDWNLVPIIKIKIGVGEIAQQLRELIILPEDLGSIPSTHMVAHNPPVNSSSREPIPFSSLCGYQGQTYMQAKYKHT